MGDGVYLPLVGLGTSHLTGSAGYEAFRTAIDIGYRHFDTATAYENEAEVGRAVRDSGVDRRDFFLTTKLPPENAGRERETLTASLKALDTDYVDLWLIHWPPNGEASPRVWEEFLAAQEEGLVRAIGVSNYSPAQIDELVDATGAVPAVNQIPWNPMRHDPSLLSAHRTRRVLVEGYTPFRHTDLDAPVLHEVAANHGVSPAQVVLRWHVEHGIVVIPRSQNPERIASNFDVFSFSLTAEEVSRIDTLSAKKEP